MAQRDNIQRDQVDQLREQRAAVAEIGRSALAGADPETLVNEAVERVCETLRLRFCQLLELQEDGKSLLLRAGAGWQDGLVGKTTFAAEGDSWAAKALRSPRAVTLAENAAPPGSPEARFFGQHGIRSGATAAIGGRAHPYGVLGAFADEERDFSEDDLKFLQQVADVLAAAIERDRVEAKLRDSQQKLELALHAGRMGAWEWDITNGSVRWSPTVEAIHGVPAGSFPGTFDAYQADMHPDDRERTLASIVAAVETGRLESEYRIILPNGAVRWLSTWGRVFRDNDGEPAEIAGVCQDITERKRARLAVEFLSEASKALGSAPSQARALRTVARLAVPMVADVCCIDLVDNRDRWHRLVEPGNRIRSGRRRPRSDVPGIVEWFGQHAPLNDGVALPPLQDFVNLWARDEMEAAALRQLGVSSVVSAPIVVDAVVVGAITLATVGHGSTFDSSDQAMVADLASRAAFAVERARLLYRSRRTEAELRVANEAKDEFLGLISHELRTPITSIYGGTSLLRRRGEQLDASSRDDVLADIERESDRLYRMVEDLLALARLEFGVAITTQPIAVPRVIDRVVTLFRRTRPARQIDVDHAPNLPPAASEFTYLEQILMNLLSNADKYSPPGKPVEVKVTHDAGERMLVVRVLDAGPGLEPGEAERIFDRFYRADGTASRARGAGLGLTVCRRLVDAQGGTIWARPRAGAGLEVGFSLPEATAEE